ARCRRSPWNSNPHAGQCHFALELAVERHGWATVASLFAPDPSLDRDGNVWLARGAGDLAGAPGLRWQFCRGPIRDRQLAWAVVGRCRRWPHLAGVPGSFAALLA